MQRHYVKKEDTTQTEHMEPSEKYVFAQKKPMYDTIPLIIFEKVEKKYPKVDVEDLKYYVPINTSNK
ncbi:hypothetical protein X777_05129 [Ooceraea biroi]|uniref:Uncharacterized protein n=1 Tax=Ooceraea biroi TaxID=2015173 RepID=A0A026WFX9_OOCBI|nr:hypothetical protein X777_05129 [Ooceraea biroi]